MTSDWTDRERSQLLALARQVLVAAVRGTAPPPVDAADFDRRAGAFVTLTRHGELRGCIGHIEPQRLGDVIGRCAAAAALEDPRFPPVSEPELSRIHIELSILGPLEPLTDPSQIEIGRHGLVIAARGRRGLLLPQVATEWGWTPVRFLEQTCVKAGLPADAWQQGAQIFLFEAEIFDEPSS